MAQSDSTELIGLPSFVDNPKINDNYDVFVNELPEILKCYTGII